MKMPDQLPAVPRRGTLATVSEPVASQTTAMPGTSQVPGSGVTASQGPNQCYALQGAAQEMCLSMFE
jgi:hypothetical protein